MKLSNKILIGFLAFIFIYMTAAFAEIRFRGVINKIDDSNSLVESVEIPDVSHMVVGADIRKRISMIGSNESSIEVRSITGDLLKHLDYNINGDTLILKKISLLEDQRILITVHVDNAIFTGLTANNSSIIVDDLNIDHFNINQQASWIRLKESNSLRNLSIRATHDASLNFFGSDLDTLLVQMDNSEIKILSPVKRVEGEMTNESYLQVRKANDIVFKKDESSRLYIN